MTGMLNINKPKGITCFGVVARVRKILGTRAVGHMGTLDPSGEGVLPIGVGKATRLFDYYLSKDKVYEAQFCFGYETDTLDGDGKITGTTETIPRREEIESILKNFEGAFMQMPPKYSAKNIDGHRAYDLARAGCDFELKTSPITIFSLKMIEQTDKDTYLFCVHCSAGTYIRSLCRDIAYSLGSLATMISIKRTRSGSFCLDNAITLEQLSEKGQNCLVPVKDALCDLPVICLSDEMYTPLNNGIKIPMELSEKHLLICKDELFGIAQSIGGILKVTTYLK